MYYFKHFALTVLVALLSALPASAYDFEVDGIAYNILSGADLTCEVTTIKGYGSYSGDVILPSAVNYEGKTYSVIGIGDSAFDHCSGLTSIMMPKSVASIGEHAFSDCM